MKNIPKLNFELPSILDWEFGANTKIAGDILQPNGQWDSFLPDLEIQRKGWDTYACVTFSDLNCVEAIIKRKYVNDKNWADRYVAKMSGTVPFQGNSLKAVAEAIKDFGNVPEEQYPFTSGMQVKEYYKEVPDGVKDMGKEWLTNWKFNYEFIGKTLNVSREKVKKALKYSPLQTAIDAGSPVDSQGIMINKRNGFNHAIMIYGYVENEYWKVYDQYKHCFRKLAWDYDFYPPIKFHIEKLNNVVELPIANGITIEGEILREETTGKVFLLNEVNEIMRFPNQDIYEKVLGKKMWGKWRDVSPEEIAKYKDVGSIDLRLSEVVQFLKKIKVI